MSVRQSIHYYMNLFTSILILDHFQSHDSTQSNKNTPQPNNVTMMTVTKMMASAARTKRALSLKQKHVQITAMRSSSSSLFSYTNSTTTTCRKSLSYNNKPSSTRLHSSSTNGGDTTTTTTALERYGLGGQHWKQFDPSAYQNLIYGALTRPRYPVDYFEIAGPDGGEIALVGSIQSAIEKIEQQHSIFKDSLPSTITITTRIGYRSPTVATTTTSTTTSNGDSDNEHQQSSASAPAMVPLRGDVVLSSSTEGGEEKEESSFNPKSSTYNLPSHVAHNIDPQYVIDTVKSSTLWELQQESILKDRLRFVFLLHNPEAQIVDLLRDQPNANHDDRQEFLRSRLTPAMDALQEFCSSSSTDISAVSSSISSFGIVSNGLSIPPSNNHPMHLSSDLVIESCQNYNKLSTVHLPANLLETHGWDVAKSIKSSSTNVEVCAIRPLSAYPDLGTGDSYPFRLVDYSLPSLEQYENEPSSDVLSKPEIKAKYTNEMNGIPIVYQMALQAAMSHFDAEPLLEAKLERELTTEERETLDGCKLVQSMIHDLDAQLQDIRSFAKHEDELYGRIIPLLYDTFEAMDDQTSDVLQAYFAAYAVAVRYAIAHKTRELLKNGEDKSMKGGNTSTITYSDIPQQMTLQEYALRRMLSKTGASNDENDGESSAGCFDRLIIGSSTSQDFEHQTHLMELIQSEDGDPLAGIRQQLEAEKIEEERQKSNKKDGNDDQE